MRENPQFPKKGAKVPARGKPLKRTVDDEGAVKTRVVGQRSQFAAVQDGRLRPGKKQTSAPTATAKFRLVPWVQAQNRLSQHLRIDPDFTPEQAGNGPDPQAGDASCLVPMWAPLSPSVVDKPFPSRRAASSDHRERSAGRAYRLSIQCRRHGSFLCQGDSAKEGCVLLSGRDCEWILGADNARTRHAQRKRASGRQRPTDQNPLDIRV